MSGTSFSWRQAMKITSPVAMGYAPAGMAFGVLASTAGIPWWMSIFISVVVFSGAAQYAAIPLIATGAGILNMSVNTLVINLRHVFYALPLVDILPKNRLKRLYCLFCLTDECFSVMTNLSKEDQRGYFPKIAVLVHFYWVFATIIGIIAGDELAKWVPNLEFALPALFVILWYEQMKNKRIWWPTIAALGFYCLMLWIVPQYVLLMALISSVVFILCRGLFSSKREKQ
ncbi:AzlC family ABC transporter permease [Ignatzschineria sp. LJL83]